MAKQYSLRFKLMGVITGLSVLALGLTALEAYSGAKYIGEAKREMLEVTSASILDKIDRNLFERYGDVQAFAMSEPARSMNPKHIQPFMTDMMAAYTPIYDMMIVVDTEGRVISANQVDKTGKAIDTSGFVGRDFSSADWFKKAMSGEVKPGTAFVQDLRLDNDVAQYAKTNGKVMNFTAPILDKNGKIVGVWSNRMSWTDVVEAIASEEGKKLISPNLDHVFYALVDNQGTYLLNSSRPELVMKEKVPDFNTVKEVAKNSGAFESQISLSEFKGTVISAPAFSRGYSSYPGIGWHFVFEAPKNDKSHAASIYLVCVAFFLQICGSFIGFRVINGVVRRLRGLSTELGAEASSVLSTSNEIGSSSQSLASASTQAASALQQTAASIEEMTAMVKKSTENAAKSNQVSSESLASVNRGKSSLDEVIRAIDEINQNNTRIMTETEESNRQITDIVKVITEIGAKTKVINDIVFQTKLLSFNASVEAARAGEHGKGFAVVAEEVGNLASMSGNAAKEISEMLEGSIRKVEGIVEGSKARVQTLVTEAKQKVETGTKVAHQCAEIFDEVVNSVNSVNVMIDEISNASREQSQGISEIAKAMNQLDEATHENATTSQESAQSSDLLRQRANSVNAIVTNLNSMVEGGEVSAVTPAAVAVTPTATVLAFEKRTDKKTKSLAKQTSTGGKTHSAPMKKAVGAEDMPSGDDPRFEDL